MFFNEFIFGQDKNKCAMMLHARYTNLPLQLIAPLHSNLYEDFKWSKKEAKSIPKDDPEKEEFDAFVNIEYVLMLAIVTSEDFKGGIKNGAVEVTGSSSLLFDSFEDEIYFNESLASVLFKLENVGEGSSGLCVASLVPVTSLEICNKSIETLVSSS